MENAEWITLAVGLAGGRPDRSRHVVLPQTSPSKGKPVTFAFAAVIADSKTFRRAREYRQPDRD
jgi:hypothetical protein